MTKDEFFKKILESKACLYRKKGDIFSVVRTSKSLPENSFEHLCFYEKWTSGGITGGSCYPDDSGCMSPIESEPEPELDSMTGFLLFLNPTLTLVDYQQICLKIIYDSYSVNEYYGNSTVYSVKYMPLTDLYDALKELNFFKKPRKRSVEKSDPDHRPSRER